MFITNMRPRLFRTSHFHPNPNITFTYVATLLVTKFIGISVIDKIFERVNLICLGEKGGGGGGGGGGREKLKAMWLRHEII